MRRHRMRRGINELGVPLVVLALLALPGCKDEPSGDEDVVSAGADEQQSGENPYLEADNLCELVPVGDVAAAAGGTEPFRTEAGTSPPASCRYFFDVPGPSGPRNASASLQMLSDFGLERTGAGEAAVDVAGLGDEAWARPHTDSYVLYVRRGNLVFSVNVAGVEEEDRPDAARAIAGVVLAALESP